MSEITKNVTGSLISAIVIALVFGIWNDYIYKKDRLTGYWKVEYKTEQSSYKPYIGLKTNYEFIIGQSGNTINGIGEKISEDSINGVIEYNAEKRGHVELQGSVTYRAFSKNSLDIVYKEEGLKRPSSTILNLVIESKNKMSGTFISTIASSKGVVTLTRVNGI
ncbi:hypothetical protein LZP69_08670 [Shewanella sp. AS1]|uniref:hypothetical protein n=1 Tax=Shewanella sp. AS1 TaxID=2907626 RepID=UPI001F2F961F|nr:hypothetical protein [Shewanella sp. AS1]MCE9679246.1 hypothetical protein [Shewanella sp. AS1]